MLLTKPNRCASLAALALFACTFGSCLNPNMINRWVAHHYSPDMIQPTKKRNEQVVVASNLPEMGNQPSETKKNWSHVLPLIVYWSADYQNTCTLNPQITINGFTAAVSTYGSRLKSRLNGGHLELTIENMPNIFVLHDKGWWAFPGISVEHLSIQPLIMDMIVSYRLVDKNNAEVKTGKITIADPNRPVGLKMFHSLKKMTWEYLDTYDANITVIGRRFVDKLAAEL